MEFILDNQFQSSEIQNQFNSRPFHFSGLKLRVIDNFDAKILKFGISKNGQFFQKNAKRKLNSNFNLFWFDRIFSSFSKDRKNVLREKKIVKFKLSNFPIEFFRKIVLFYWILLRNLAISGPGNCKIWNLGIKIGNTTKFELWEVMGLRV